MSGQIDASPAIMEAKITFEQAKDNLIEAVLKLLKVVGDPGMTNMEHILADLSQDNTIEVQSQTTKEKQDMSISVSEETAITPLSKELNDIYEVPTAQVMMPGYGGLDMNSNQIRRKTQLQEQEGLHASNTESCQEEHQIQTMVQDTDEVLSSRTNGNHDDDLNNKEDGAQPNINNNRQSRIPQIVKPKFRQIISDIAQLDGDNMVAQFKKDIEDFQMRMLNEVRTKATIVETKRFTPPVGYVPKRLSKSQFKRFSEGFTKKEGDAREKQYRFLNLMNLIQTKFKADNKRKTPDVAQIIHRKMCDGIWPRHPG